MPPQVMSPTFNPIHHPILFTTPYRLHKKSAWTEHTPFAMLLVELLKPCLVVELGTHVGVSYCAFCQAVTGLKLAARCFAVDTWQGDAHATHYKESVFEELCEYHRRYEPFSTLLRMTFDQAAGKFKDRSIDLLHIDGLHTYEAVRHDYQTWLPKLSERSVVLFHDTMETAGDFGVHQLWRELAPMHPSFQFEHGHGLGILAVGEQAAPPLIDFLREANSQPENFRRLFSTLGRKVLLETERQWLAKLSPIERSLSVLNRKKFPT